MDLDVLLVDYFQDTSVVWKLRWRCRMNPYDRSCSWWLRRSWCAEWLGWGGLDFDDDVEEGSDRCLAVVFKRRIVVRASRGHAPVMVELSSSGLWSGLENKLLLAFGNRAGLCRKTCHTK